MTTPATLALCIPAYGAERHLPRLLGSALAQRPQFDEIVVCVDASPDRTAEVAREWGVTVVENDRNMGCSRSKNRALQAATCGWVHFRDADDVLLPGFTEEAHRWIAAADCPDVVLMGFEYRDFETNELLATNVVDDCALSADPLAFAIAQKLPNSGIYRREALAAVEGFDCDPEVLFNEDVAFHIRLALAGFRFGASQRVTSINWRHPGSMSAANPVACLLAHRSVMRKVAGQADARYSEAIARRLWLVATELAMYREWDLVDETLAEARTTWRGVPSGHSRDFAFLCRVCGPRLAFRVRERVIRVFKPGMRRGLLHAAPPSVPGAQR